MKTRAAFFQKVLGRSQVIIGSIFDHFSLLFAGPFLCLLRSMMVFFKQELMKFFEGGLHRSIIKSTDSPLRGKLATVHLMAKLYIGMTL